MRSKLLRVLIPGLIVAFAAIMEAILSDPSPELAQRLVERCQGLDEARPVRELLERWGRGEVAFVDPHR